MWRTSGTSSTRRRPRSASRRSSSIASHRFVFTRQFRAMLEGHHSCLGMLSCRHVDAACLIPIPSHEGTGGCGCGRTTGQDGTWKFARHAWHACPLCARARHYRPRADPLPPAPLATRAATSTAPSPMPTHRRRTCRQSPGDPGAIVKSIWVKTRELTRAQGLHRPGCPHLFQPPFPK